MRYIVIFLLAVLGSAGVRAQNLKVMSYNIHVGQDGSNKDQLKNMAEFIKNSDADIVGVQEVDSVCNRSGKIDQMKFLAENTGMHFAYARHFAFDGGSYGIGILSKFPLTNVKDHRIILTSEGTAEAATRALLTASILSGNKEIMFATVHMDYRDSNSRLAQSQELVKLFGQIRLPVVFTGDLNAEPGTKEILHLQTIFTDTSKDNDLTFSASKPVKKIDFVMVSKANLAKVRKVEVYPVLLSDHLPLMTTLKIKRNN